jgi:carbamoyl-phosphate synthase large subunit
MKTVLVTSTGCPGAYNLIMDLKERFRIIAVDMDSNVISRHIADKFYVVPPYDAWNYIPEILRICKKEGVDLIFPESSYEVEVLSRAKELFEFTGIVLATSDHDVLHIANNKYETYKKLIASDCIPKFAHFNGHIRDWIYKFGYPDKKVCIKPAFSKGGRGFKIIDATMSKEDILNQRGNKYTTLEFIDDIYFKDYLIMEYLEGEEIDSMVLCYEGEPLVITHKTREKENRGTITYGELVKRPKLDKYIKEILKKIPLSYNVSIQFKGGKLIEINPRTSTYIWGLPPSEPMLAIYIGLGMVSLEWVKSRQEEIPIGRKMIRYFTQYCW